MAGTGKMLVAWVLVIALVLTITACGGDSSSTDTSPTQSSTTTATTDERTSAESGTTPPDESQSEKGEGNSARSDEGSEESAGSAKQRDGSGSSGGKSSSQEPNYGVVDIDNSIQKFGKEANDSDREAASAVLETYFQARAAGDQETACASLSKDGLDHLDDLARVVSKADVGDCVATFTEIDRKLPPSARANPMTGPVSSLRTGKGRSFAIFPAVRGAEFTIQMAQEGGSWKVAALVPFELG